MKVTLFLSMLLAVIAFSCTTFNDQDYAFALLRSHSKQLKRSRGLQLFGIGGRTGNDITTIMGTYQSRRKVDVQEARMLFVEAAQGYIDLINADKRIRPYLHDYPFGPENLNFAIVFADKTGDFTKEGYIAAVGLMGDRVSYCVYDDNTGTNLREIWNEPYEEAVRIVQGKNCSTLGTALP